MKFTCFDVKLNLLVDSVLELSQKTKKVTDEIKSLTNISRSIIDDIRELTDIFLYAETKIRTDIEETVVPIAKNLQTLGEGVRAFWKNYKKLSYICF